MARRPPKGFSNWSEYYRYRIERGAARGLTRSQARGHPGKGQPLASQVERRVQIVGASGPLEVTVIGTRASSRAARYDNDARRLLEGKIAPGTFNRRWAGKGIGDVLLPNADQVLALAHQGLASFDDFYPRRSP